MLSLAYEARNAGRIAIRLEVAAETADEEARRITRHWGAVLAARVRELAPYETGHYRSTIRWYVRGGKGTPYVSVQSSHPASRRLELGFHGRDALGRHYADPPRPHFRPAAAAIAPLYLESLRQMAQNVVR